MEQRSSREGNRSSTTQKIPRILGNPKVHYRFRKSPPPVSILSKIDAVHASHPTSLRFILILSSHLRLGLPNGSFPLKVFFYLASIFSRTLFCPIHGTSVFLGVRIIGRSAKRSPETPVNTKNDAG